MACNWILTVGREFCSGGAEVGRKVAEKLAVPLYDKKIIDATAEMLKLSPQVIERHDEKPTHVWEMSGMSGTGFQYGNTWYAADPSLLMPLSYKIADAQFSIIQQMANEGPCVLVGRCADYVLRNRPHVLNVFLRADINARVHRAMELYRLTDVEALKLVRKTDRIRANYYNGHTHKKWGEAEGYHLVLDTSLLGIDETVELLVSTLERLSARETSPKL